MAVEYELKYRATPEVLERIQADFPEAIPSPR